MGSPGSPRVICGNGAPCTGPHLGECGVPILGEYVFLNTVSGSLEGIQSLCGIDTTWPYKNYPEISLGSRVTEGPSGFSVSPMLSRPLNFSRRVSMLLGTLDGFLTPTLATGISLASLWQSVTCSLLELARPLASFLRGTGLTQTWGSLMSQVRIS